MKMFLKSKSTKKKKKEKTYMLPFETFFESCNFLKNSIIKWIALAM